MKTIQTISAVIMIIGTTAVHAATYYVFGTQELVDANTPSTIVVTSFPATPQFEGYWEVTTSALSSDVFFEPYDLLLDPFFTLEYADAGYTIVGGTLGYNPGTRTLTLTNATATYTGSTPICTGYAPACYAHPGQDFEDLDLALTFSAMFDTFSGTIIAVNDGGVNGFYTHFWSFEGVEEVPLPAAAWFLGSGLISLAAAGKSLRKP